VSLTGSSALTLNGEVKVSGIPENAHYWVQVVLVSTSHRQGRCLRAARNSALSGTARCRQSGQHRQQVRRALASTEYPAVSVEAWYGDHAGPCGSLTLSGGANLTHAQAAFVEENSRPGCVVVRLPTRNPRSGADLPVAARHSTVHAMPECWHPRTRRVGRADFTLQLAVVDE